MKNSNNINKRILGNSELKVSRIGMGCVTFGREIDQATSFGVLDRALERGINLFDTAAAYAAGASELVVGQWVADRGIRDEIVLATKIHGGLTQHEIIKSAEDSLVRLQTDYIDLFQLHHWDDETPLEEMLAGLNSLVESGKVRSIGCSNWQASQLVSSLQHCRDAGLHQIQSVQPPYNLIQREIESDLLPLCATEGIGVITYSPLAAGFLTGKYRRGNNIPTGTRFDIIPGHQPIYMTDYGYSVLERLEQAAEQTDRSMIQIALAWALTRPGITSVLIGARNPSQVDQAFTAAVSGIDEELRDNLELLRDTNH
jgi:aryl-alcohol dehydrogenase-like predicted oxidoreductase